MKRSFVVTLKPKSAHFDERMGLWVKPEYLMQANVNLTTESQAEYATTSEEYITNLVAKENPEWNISAVEEIYPTLM